MKICVLGLGHLGLVTAASLSTLGHHVVGVDFDTLNVGNLRKGIAPIVEPGFNAALEAGLRSDSLRFATTLEEARGIDLLWVAFDTPVDDADHADAEYVLKRAERALIGVDPGTTVLISSQLPVGSIRRLERFAATHCSELNLTLASSPENLRLGSAMNDFLHPSRIIVGVRSDHDKEKLANLFGAMTDSIEWMSVESAEMTKHAINVFFATSIAFANEIASVCESVGADAKEVERGLKSEARIGQGACLSPGAAFAGGTLARDVVFLAKAAVERHLTTPLIAAVMPSNDAHKQWVQRKLQMLFGDLSRITVAVWGLTYKPGTDTLSRSMWVELCDWLLAEGIAVHVHDPIVGALPSRWCEKIRRFDDPIAAVQGAHALIMATCWPLYQSISADRLRRSPDRLVVLDPNRFLHTLAAAESNVEYLSVGLPAKDAVA